MTRLHVQAIDHLVVAVGDLDAARDRYARLGFRVTPRGRHTLLLNAHKERGCGSLREESPYNTVIPAG